MITANRVLILATAALLVYSGAARAGDEPPVTVESTVSEDAVESCIGASRVNFHKEFGLPLEYLDSIGQQIHDARQTPDPVRLALCAKALAVAEQLSGKRACITAEQVMNEAVELAKLRGDSSELRAVAMLVDEATGSELNELAKVAAEAEAEAREAARNGETPKELIGTLLVINHSPECVKIYMDGRYLGIVHQGHSTTFHVHNHNWHNHLDAYCLEAGHLVQHGDIAGHYHFLRWVIH